MKAPARYGLVLLVGLAVAGCGSGAGPGADAAGLDALPTADGPAPDAPLPDLPLDVVGDVPVDLAGDPAQADAPADASADAAGDGPPADLTGEAPGDGGSGTTCVFNRDCPASERCECDEAKGCFCRTGVRGTGRSGIDPCVDGNDCESSLCVEGQDGYYCSGECETDADCGNALPECVDIADLGRICIR